MKKTISVTEQATVIQLQKALVKFACWSIGIAVVAVISLFFLFVDSYTFMAFGALFCLGAFSNVVECTAQIASAIIILCRLQNVKT